MDIMSTSHVIRGGGVELSKYALAIVLFREISSDTAQVVYTTVMLKNTRTCTTIVNRKYLALLVIL